MSLILDRNLSSLLDIQIDKSSRQLERLVWMSAKRLGLDK